MHSALLLEMAGESFPERIATGPLADGVSFSELAGRARGGGAWLAAKGADKVVFCGLNGSALPALLFAAGEIARPFAPLNYRLKDDELRRLLERTAPSVAIVDDDMVSRVAGVPGVEIVTRTAFEAACLDPANREAEGLDVDHDIAVLLFTSGTTGDPKVAVLRHRHLTSYVISTVEFMGSDEDEAALVSVPPYHIAGISAILTAVYSGRRLVYLPAFTPEEWVDLAAKERITHAMVVPTMLGRILQVLEQRGETLPALRGVSYGGGRMPQATVEKALQVLPHVDFVNAYGLTETSSTISILTADDHREAIASTDPNVRRRLGSVGRPLPTLELEIRDPDGKLLPAGESGEVYVRGEQVAGEYLHKSALLSDGWFPTNDAGWLDEDGYLFVEGRLDDVIVRGGENISPGEIEDVLRKHPKVSDVAVFGVPDNEWGEKIACAVVVEGTPPSSDELADFVRGVLRSTKTPEVWSFREALPYNDTGKLLRRQLKAEMSPQPATA
ncbi:MAG TPA: fatty acid--CoA ligase family protein [Caulobacteraceae bacterium]|jgi:acyl-CoA synthetase (AMP-forming)/AMP-acid ligase II